MRRKSLKITAFFLALATALSVHAMERLDVSKLELTCATRSKEYYKNTLIASARAWLHRADITEKEVVEALRSRGLSTQNIDVTNEETRHLYCCACLDEDIRTGEESPLGICNAHLILCSNAAPEYHGEALRCGGMFVGELLLDFLKDKKNFAILSLFITYANYCGKGYGPIFWEKIMDFLRREHPHITTVVFLASPLYLHKNALPKEKLYEFYKKLGARQIHPNVPNCFYYDLTKKNARLLKGMRHENNYQDFAITPLTLEKETEGTTTATTVQVWLHPSTITQDDISHRLEQCNMLQKDVNHDNHKLINEIHRVCLQESEGTLGRGSAKLTIFNNIPFKLHDAALSNSGINYSTSWRILLKDCINFAILNKITTYTKYRGNGCGRIFFDSLIKFLRKEHPNVTKLVFLAVPLDNENGLSTQGNRS